MSNRANTATISYAGQTMTESLHENTIYHGGCFASTERALPQAHSQAEDKMIANQASTDGDKITAVQGNPVSGTTTPSNISDLDDDYHLYKRSDEQELDLAESNKVLHKLDRRIVPILFFIYLLQYLDKNGINYASVYGLQKGTNLHGQNYNWLG